MPDLDELLRADGVQWRSQVDAYRPGDVAGLAGYRHTARRTRWRAPLFAAAAVALVAAGISVLAIRGHTPSDPYSELPVLPTAGTTADPLTRPARFVIDYAQRHTQPLAMTEVQPAGAIVGEQWDFIKLLDAGRSVLVSFQLGDSCGRELGFRVQQGRNAVELTSLVDNNGGTCRQAAPVGYGIVQLGRPLRGRALLHGPVSNKAAGQITWQVQPWVYVPIHPTDDPSVMLIDSFQGTRDTHSPCWEESRTTTTLVAGKFEITLWVENGTDQGTGGGPASGPPRSCPAVAIAGPFYATVHLPLPYAGQPLIDAVSGRDHQPADLVRLADAPRRFR